MLMVELLTCSFPRKYHSDLNNLCNYIFITYLLTVLLFSTCSDLPLCWGKFQEVASCCSEKSCIYLNFGNSSVRRCFCCFIFSPTDDRRWRDIRSVQVNDTGRAGTPLYPLWHKVNTLSISAAAFC